MRYASDFREIARDALRGKWPVAVLAGFLASLMGAGSIINGGGSSGSSSESNAGNWQQAVQTTELWTLIQAALITGVVVFVIWAIFTLIFGGAARLGYSIFNLKLVDGKEVTVSDVFSQIYRLRDGFCMKFLVALYTALWSMLFVIPGVIKQYSYAMTPYILAENPDLTATEAITESRRVMDGNKWRLFCLGFSFLGWRLLCAVPVLVAFVTFANRAISTGDFSALLWLIPGIVSTVIGWLFLTPYEEAAYAAFYRDITGAPTYYGAREE